MCDSLNQRTKAEIDIDNLLGQLREEVKQRRRNIGVVASATPMSGEKYDPRPAELIRLTFSDIPRSIANDSDAGATGNIHELSEILRFDDAAFIRVAYRTVLVREVDRSGLDCYLGMLRSGASKIEILGRLRYSPEGRLRKTQLDGLLGRYLVDRAMRWPIIGRIVAVAVALFTVPESRRQQRRTSNDIAIRLDQYQLTQTEIVDSVVRNLRTLEQAVNSLNRLAPTFASLANLHSMQSSLIKLSGGQQDLQVAIAERISIKELDSRLGEILALVSTKADQSVIPKVLEQIRSLSREKADALVIEGLKGDINSLSTYYANSTKMQEIEIGQIRDKAAELSRQLALVDASVAERQQDLARIRTQFHQLVDSADKTASARLKELSDIRSTLNELKLQIAWINDNKADRNLDLAAIVKQVSGLSKWTQDAANAQLKELGDTRDCISELSHQYRRISEDKAGRAEVERLAKSIRAADEAISDLRLGKADVVEIAALRRILEAEVATNTQQSIDELFRALKRLDESKAAQTSIDILKDETLSVIEVARRTTLERIDDALGPISAKLRDVRRNVIDQERRISLLLGEARKRLPEPISRPQILEMVAEESHVLDAMYASFEDQFRGTRDAIRQRQAVYVPYVRQVSAGTTHAPIVDIGCGRGEWLELLRDESLIARGVDTNRVFVEQCRELSLDVVEHDALAFLRELSAGSVGAVTSFHMIEHLPNKYLIALIDEAFRVLQSGGLVIFETPNPRNLIVASCTFYMDPTHRHPLPPDLSRYLLEARGFERVEVKELHPVDSDHLMNCKDPVARETLNRILNSAQDYAVIGRKL